MPDNFGRGGCKSHAKIAKQIWKHIFSVQLTRLKGNKLSNNLDYLLFFREKESVFKKFQPVKW